MRTDFCQKIEQPVPLPTANVQQVRQWLERNLPLQLCGDYAATITNVSVDCGFDAPGWLRKLAREVAELRPQAHDVQIAAYVAVVQRPLHECYERIFDRTLDSADRMRETPWLRFEKFMGQYYRLKLEMLAGQTSEYQENIPAARAALSRVWFDVSCDPLLF